MLANSDHNVLTYFDANRLRGDVAILTWRGSGPTNRSPRAGSPRGWSIGRAPREHLVGAIKGNVALPTVGLLTRRCESLTETTTPH
jgi:hypothetical protein